VHQGTEHGIVAFVAGDFFFIFIFFLKKSGGGSIHLEAERRKKGTAP
jgi:hypothetical protein